MKKLTFEIHQHAPELNKVFFKGIKINKILRPTTLAGLSKDYDYNCRLIRAEIKPKPYLRKWIFTAIRPDGSSDIRFCFQHDIKDVLNQTKIAKRHYNIEGTEVKFKPFFNYFF